jgi:hypothetical protein
VFAEVNNILLDLIGERRILCPLARDLDPDLNRNRDLALDPILAARRDMRSIRKIRIRIKITIRIEIKIAGAG